MKQNPDSSRSGASSASFASTPAYYEICVNGRLGRQSSIWFDDMAVTVDEGTMPPRTVIYGRVRDQAALYGLISRARDLGLTLLSVKRVGPQEEAQR
jgi:hypothetical protein